MKYSKKDIMEAKEFLKRRLAAERTIRNDMESLLEEYAKILVEVCYSVNVKPKNLTFEYNITMKNIVREVLKKLEQLIYDRILDIASYERDDDRDDVNRYINRGIACKNLKVRISEYVSMFEKEVEALSVSCKWSGESYTNALVLVTAALKAPYKFPQFKDAVQEGGFKASRIRTGRYRRGVGQTNISLNGISKLASYSVSDAWMHFNMLDAKEEGAKGFISFRGSSYPCSLCDDYTGYHDIQEFSLPLHPNCCCYPIYIY